MKKTGHDETQKGKRIDNIPDSGTLTGVWKIDTYGCWWQYVRDQKKSVYGRELITWIIGEYPNEILTELFTLFAWVDNEWVPFTINMTLLQEQKEWLYQKREKYGYNHETEILDGILEMFESIQDLWNLQKGKK